MAPLVSSVPPAVPLADPPVVPPASLAQLAFVPMCALQFAAQLEKMKNKENSNGEESKDKIRELIDMIDIHLTAY